jgi:hypothetical protein
MNDMARLLMLLGGGLFLMGLLFYFGARLPWFGNLPGDIVIKRDNFTLIAPIGTMIVVSIVLTVLLNVIGRWLR